MKEEILRDLVEKTFAKLAYPAQGVGMYAEIERVLEEAYQLGFKRGESLPSVNNRKELLYTLFNDGQ